MFVYIEREIEEKGTPWDRFEAWLHKQNTTFDEVIEANEQMMGEFIKEADLLDWLLLHRT